jgi:hypothetical protein
MGQINLGQNGIAHSRKEHISARIRVLRSKDRGLTTCVPARGDTTNLAILYDVGPWHILIPTSTIFQLSSEIQLNERPAIYLLHQLFSMASIHSATKEERAQDLEKHTASSSISPAESAFDETLKSKSSLWRRILGWGVEANGIIPVPVEKRTDTRVFNLFTIWFTALLCLLPCVNAPMLNN